MSYVDARSRKRHGGFRRNRTFNKAIVNDWVWVESGRTSEVDGTVAVQQSASGTRHSDIDTEAVASCSNQTVDAASLMARRMLI